MKSQIIVTILFSLLFTNLNCQETDSFIYNKIIDLNELKQLRKTNPNLKTYYIIENGKVLNNKEFSTIFDSFEIFKYKQTVYMDSINSNITIRFKKLTKKEYEKRQLDLTAKYDAQIKERKESRKNLDGTIIDELNLEDLNNEKHTLNTLKGKVIVLNFWFIQCKPCIEEFPDLNELKEHFKNQPVEFFAVTFNKKEALNTFFKNHKLDFTIIHSNMKLIKKFGIPHYPFFIIIDKNGEIDYFNDVLSFNIFNKLKRKIKNSL